MWVVVFFFCNTRPQSAPFLVNGLGRDPSFRMGGPVTGGTGSVMDMVGEGVRP